MVWQFPDDYCTRIPGMNVIPDDYYTRILGLNVCGLQGKLRLGILEKYIENIDVVCLSETKVSSTNMSVHNSFHSHRIVLKKGSNGEKRGGTHGLAILYSKHLDGKVTVLDDQATSNHVMWAKVELDDNVRFILGNVYIPNEGSIHHDEEWQLSISSDIISLSDYCLPFVLIGDFNARTGALCDFFDEVDESVARECGLDLASDLPGMHSAKEDLETMGIDLLRHNKDTHTNNNGKKLIELCQIFNFTILNGRFGADKGVGEHTCTTARGQSVIDYILMSSEMLPIIKDFRVDAFDSCLSDTHCPLRMTLIGQKLQSETSSSNNVHVVETTENREPTSTEPQTQFRTKWKGDLCKAYQALCINEALVLEERIVEIETKLEAGSLEENEMENVSKTIAAKLLQPALDLGMTKAIKPHCQRQKITKRRQNKPWFNEECKIQRQCYMNLKKTLIKRKTREARDELKRAAKKYKQFIRTTSRKYYHDIHTSLRNMQSNDPREYWRAVRQAEVEQTEGICPLGQLEEHFRGLSAGVERDDRAPTFGAAGGTTDGGTSTYEDLLDQPLSLEEVLNARKDLKSHKSAGVDGVANEFLKYCPTSTLSVITRWFNSVLDSAFVPTDWCTGIITPIYKGKGSRDNPDNYQGITLLSCIGKLFTSVINRRLKYLVEQEQIIGPEQAGFRPQHSTVDHGFALHCIVSYYLSKRKRGFTLHFLIIKKLSTW